MRRATTTTAGAPLEGTGLAAARTPFLAERSGRVSPGNVLLSVRTAFLFERRAVGAEVVPLARPSGRRVGRATGLAGRTRPAGRRRQGGGAARRRPGTAEPAPWAGALTRRRRRPEGRRLSPGRWRGQPDRQPERSARRVGRAGPLARQASALARAAGAPVGPAGRPARLESASPSDGRALSQPPPCFTKLNDVLIVDPLPPGEANWRRRAAALMHPAI